MTPRKGPCIGIIQIDICSVNLYVFSSTLIYNLRQAIIDQTGLCIPCLLLPYTQNPPLEKTSGFDL